MLGETVAIIALIETGRKARLWRASLLRRPHDGTSMTATQHRSGKARVCDDSVLMSSGSMHAYALNRTKQQSMNHVVMHMV